MAPMIESRRQLRERIEALAEPEFQKFSASLIPGVNRLLGVRLPVLRNLAREVAGGIGGSCWKIQPLTRMRRK